MTERASRADHARTRAIVVGAGLMGRWHADAASRAGAQIVAVVDPDRTQRHALASRHGASEVETLSDVAADGDIVHVCSPPATHGALAADALARGCHVIVEKPVAPDAEEVERLLAQAQQADRLLVPVHQYLFQRGVARATTQLPGLGAPLHVDALACTAGADGLGDSGRDVLAMEVLPHALSVIARLVDPSIDTVTWRATRTRAGELRVDGTLGSTSIGITVSTHGRPTTNQLRLVCPGGTLRLDFFHGFSTCVRGAPTRAFKVAHPFVHGATTLASAATNLAIRAARAEGAYPGLRELVAATYRVARGSADVWAMAPITAQETLATARAIDAIRGAAGVAV